MGTSQLYRVVETLFSISLKIIKFNSRSTVVLNVQSGGRDKKEMLAHLKEKHGVVIELENMDYLLRTDKTKWLNRFVEVMPKIFGKIMR